MRNFSKRFIFIILTIIVLTSNTKANLYDEIYYEPISFIEVDDDFINSDEYVYHDVSDDDGNVAGALIISVIITGVFMWVTVSAHKMVRKQKYAREYVKNFCVVNRQDDFLHTHTSKMRISK